MSVLAVAVFLLALSGRVPVAAQRQQPADPKMNFFVSSVGLGRGGNLGGVAGADKHCVSLAAAAGSGRRLWRAYLSAPRSDKQPEVHARDRIGGGPWFNARGVQISATLDDLHGGLRSVRAVATA